MKNDNATAPAIHRFELGTKQFITVKMPVGAIIVDVQPGSKGLSAWAMVEPEAKTERRFFGMFKTGQAIPSGWDMVHLKTLVTPAGAVHLFEIPAHIAKSVAKGE